MRRSFFIANYSSSPVGFFQVAYPPTGGAVGFTRRRPRYSNRSIYQVIHFLLPVSSMLRSRSRASDYSHKTSGPF